jgi:hypothetical protein
MDYYKLCTHIKTPPQFSVQRRRRRRGRRRRGGGGWIQSVNKVRPRVKFDGSDKKQRTGAEG